MNECLFCGIATGEIDASVVADDDRWLAFRDINPQAPTHILVIPKRHVATVNDLTGDDETLVGELVRAAARIATDEGIAEDGYRLVLNTNAGAGQTVFHLHLHLLGGRPLSWPPG
ncbi:MAG: histidine triad nucleotide-binding protein [Gemmatimonadetes bacterium]|nr:histidine triad nucleotide-binding protein [Gemmatimonadota bacterium]